MHTRKLKVIVAVGATLVVLVGTTGAAYEDPAAGEKAAVAAIDQVAPEIIESSVGVAESADGLVATSESTGFDVTFPADAATGVVEMTSDTGSTLTMGLPVDDGASPEAINGAVAYDANNGSHIVTSLGDQGQLTTLTVIGDATAPDSYSYDMGVPEGGVLELDPWGGAAVMDSSGTTIAYSPAPWAKDANGSDVPTWYTVAGNTLTQHVDFSSPSLAFPVVADPAWFQEWWGNYLRFGKSETKTLAAKSGWANAVAFACGAIPVAAPRVACMGMVGIKAASLVTVSREAAAANQCFYLNIPYPVAGVGYSYLTMNFTRAACMVR